MAFQQTGVQKHGAAAIIEGQTLNQCTNPGPFEGNGTWAWAALGDGGGSNTILQVGTGRCREFLNSDCTWNMEYYWTWGIDPEAPGCTGWARTLPTPFQANGWDGASHEYKVYHQSNAWKFYAGSTLLRTQPEADICWTPTIAWWFNESWDNGDALGGTSANHLRTSYMRYANTENGAFSYTGFSPSANCTFNPGSGRFCDIVSSTSYDAWTNR
jgi:hypothetical protein